MSFTIHESLEKRALTQKPDLVDLVDEPGLLDRVRVLCGLLDVHDGGKMRESES